VAAQSASSPHQSQQQAENKLPALYNRKFYARTQTVEAKKTAPNQPQRHTYK